MKSDWGPRFKLDTYAHHKERVESMILRDVRDLNAKISGQSLNQKDKDELKLKVIEAITKTFNQ